MTHILSHLVDMTPEQPTRPDFWVIEYMAECNLISKEDYEHAISYTERGCIDVLVNDEDDEHETPEMKIKKEIHSQTAHDLRKEERDGRNLKQKGKSKRLL